MADDIGARLDAFFDSCKPIFSLPDGQAVTVPFHFRMANGGGQKSTGEARAQLDAQLGAAPGSADDQAVFHVVQGRGTPAQAIDITQRLLDAGLLPDSDPPGYDDDLFSRVRHLMWDWDIGMDCAGYVSQALPAGLGCSAADLGIDNVIKQCGLLSFAPNKFDKVGINDVQTGDVLQLDDPQGGVGHFVVVRSVSSFTPFDDLVARDPEFFASPGDLLLYEVHSSFGAAGLWYTRDAGVSRRHWLHNTTADLWAYYEGTDANGNIQFGRYTEGPYDHTLGGVYRARSSS
jgi:hypothetical protein